MDLFYPQTYRKKIPRIQVIKWWVNSDGLFTNYSGDIVKDNYEEVKHFLGTSIEVQRRDEYLEIGNLMVKPGNLIVKDESGILSIMDESTLTRDYDLLYGDCYSDQDYDMVSSVLPEIEYNEKKAEAEAWS